MGEMKEFLKTRKKANLTMVCLNILVFLVMEIMLLFTEIPHIEMLGSNYGPNVWENGEYYRLLTCMFIHFGIEHLGSNMLVLIFLGDMLEHIVGTWRYLVIYLGGGLFASAVSCYSQMQSGEYALSAGASGAIFAVIGALVLIVIVNKGKLEELSGKRLLIMAALSLYQGFTSTSVDNMAHVGGFVSGILLALLLYRRKKNRKSSSDILL